MSESAQSPDSPKRLYRRTSQRLKPPMFSLTQSVAKFIKQAEVELEGEYATYCGQVSIQSAEERQETLNLRTELNRITAQCQRKAGLLMRLQTLLKFPVQAQPLSPDFALLFDSPSNRLSDLHTALADAGTRTETEEQQTEVLQGMLATVTQTATIMRERTTATQAVLNRVSSQLYQVNRLHTVALNSLTLTSVSASQSRLALVATKELVLDRISRKKSDKVVLERASRKAVERIGTAVCSQVEAARKKQVFRETVEAAGVRHAGEKQRKAQTAKDLELYYSGFHTIAQVLARRGCTLTYQFGMSAESIHMLVAQLNHLAMREASLASRHSQLALDRCEKEAELRSLRSQLLVLTSFKEKTTIKEESHSQKQPVRLEGKAEELCIRLHAGVLSVLGQLDFVHQHTSRSSTVDRNWALVHSLAQQLPASPESAQRSSTRSKTFITAGKTTVEAEKWNAAFHICPNTAEVRALAREIGVMLEEEEFEALDWLMSRTLVVKHCADWAIIKEFLLRVKKQKFEPGALLEKCHLVLRSGFKEEVDTALKAIKSVKKLESGETQYTHLSRTTSCRSLPSEEQFSPASVSKQDKHYARLRINLLPYKTEDNFTDESHSQPQSRSEAKHPTQTDSSKPPSPLCDETAETQHILATRSEFKSSRLSTAAFSKRSEPPSSVRFRHLHQRETPPTTERAQNLLRDFLATERRIAAVKGAERVSAKAESARHTPKALWTRTNTAAGYRRHHRSTLSLGSTKPTLQF